MGDPPVDVGIFQDAVILESVAASSTGAPGSDGIVAQTKY